MWPNNINKLSLQNETVVLNKQLLKLCNLQSQAFEDQTNAFVINFQPREVPQPEIFSMLYFPQWAVPQMKYISFIVSPKYYYEALQDIDHIWWPLDSIF